MDSILHKLLRILRDQVNQNNKEIQYNQEDINQMLTERKPSAKEDNLDFKYSLNKELMDENADFIKFQITITGFLEKYGSLFNSLESAASGHENNHLPEVSGEDNLFMQTVNGIVNFDNKHPKFGDSLFFNRLIKYYQDREDYEMCNSLIKLVRSHS